MHEWSRRYAGLPDIPPRILVPTRAIVLLLGRRRNQHRPYGCPGVESRGLPASRGRNWMVCLDHVLPSSSVTSHPILRSRGRGWGDQGQDFNICRDTATLASVGVARHGQIGNGSYPPPSCDNSAGVGQGPKWGRSGRLLYARSAASSRRKWPYTRSRWDRLVRSNPGAYPRAP